MVFENFVQFILPGMKVSIFVFVTIWSFNVSRIGEWSDDRSVKLVISWFILFGKECMKKSMMSGS